MYFACSQSRICPSPFPEVLDVPPPKAPSPSPHREQKSSLQRPAVCIHAVCCSEPSSIHSLLSSPCMSVPFHPFHLTPLSPPPFHFRGTSQTANARSRPRLPARLGGKVSRDSVAMASLSRQLTQKEPLQFDVSPSMLRSMARSCLCAAVATDMQVDSLKRLKLGNKITVLQ